MEKSHFPYLQFSEYDFQDLKLLNHLTNLKNGSKELYFSRIAKAYLPKIYKNHEADAQGTKIS